MLLFIVEIKIHLALCCVCTLVLDSLHDALQDLILLSLLDALPARGIQTTDQALDLLSLACFFDRFPPTKPLLIVIELLLILAEPRPLDNLIGAKFAAKGLRLVIVAHAAVVKMDVAIATSSISTAPWHVLRPTTSASETLKNSR